MDHLLHLRIDLDHLVVQLGVVLPHNLGSPTGGNEGGVDPTRQRSGEDICDLEPDEEGEGDDEYRVLSLVVISGLREVQIQVGEEGAGICYE